MVFFLFAELIRCSLKYIYTNESSTIIAKISDKNTINMYVQKGKLTSDIIDTLLINFNKVESEFSDERYLFFEYKYIEQNKTKLPDFSIIINILCFDGSQDIINIMSCTPNGYKDVKDIVDALCSCLNTKFTQTLPFEPEEVSTLIEANKITYEIDEFITTSNFVFFLAPIML